MPSRTILEILGYGKLTENGTELMEFVDEEIERCRNEGWSYPGSVDSFGFGNQATLTCFSS